MALVVWLQPTTATAVAKATTTASAASPGGHSAGVQITYKTLQTVLEQRCYLCHGATVQSKGVRLDSPQLVKQHAANIYQQVVMGKLMPMNNATTISDAERQLIAQWYVSGASVD